jgi:hypothetical protein
MTAAIPIPNRVLALLGIAVLVLVGLLVARPLLTSSDDSTAPSAASPTHVTQAAPTAPAAKPAVPKVVLVPGIPHVIAAKLMHSRVTVVSVYSGTSASDRAALAQARDGARAAGVAFARLNVLDDKAASQLQAFGGTMTTPTVLVVRRPGKIVAKFESLVDSAVVEQAAHNARGGSKGGKK